MLELAAIDRAFGARRALHGVSLRVTTGEVVLLVGRNGAGKTTLLRVATGFLDPDRGAASIDGRSLVGDRAHAQAKLGYLPEQAPAPVDVRVDDWLAFRARLKRCDGDAVTRALAAVGMADHVRRRIGELSKGMRQRIGLADALLGEPPLIVLDEPTSGLDPIQVRELRDYLAAIATGRALLISSHAVADLAPLATRIAVLRRGELVADAAPHVLADDGALDDAVVRLLDDGATT